MILSYIGVGIMCFFGGLVLGSLIKELEVRRYVAKQVSFAKSQKQGFEAQDNETMAACWGSRINELEILAVQVLEKRDR